MRKLTVTLCLTLAVLLGSVVVSFALPPCPKGVFGVSAFITGVGDCSGTKNYGSGAKYVGEFKDGKFHGQGTLTYDDGSKYVGEWNKNKRDGFGVYTDKDGTIYSGQFSAEYPGKWGKHGNGKIVFLDGRSFEGRWINNYPSDGILTGRSGKNISLDYGWDRGKFRGGSLYKIIISFEGGAKFIGEVDRRYNPTKGKFIDKFGGKIDPKKFADFFRVSSSYSNSADFQKGIAAFLRGDYEAALRELRPLAEQGDANAQFQIGWMYYKGRGVPQNYKTAVKWYRLAAEQGNASAQTFLGSMYGVGEGTPQDYRAALKWYTLAAKQGNRIAQVKLGHMYAEGLGISQNYKTAAKWFKLAAKQGDAGAQSNLASMYAFGRGVLKDYVRAHMWGNIAATNGSKLGAKLRDDFEKKMIPADIAKAQKLARECVRKKYIGC